jgi:HK97 family phage portal protein
VTFFGRTLATTVVPFTPATYDEKLFARSGAGVISVTPESALGIPAVYACTVVISETVATLPLQVFEREGRGKKVADNHPLYELLHDQPNEYQTAVEFREMMTAFAVNRGRGVAEIIPGRRGAVDQLKPLHPDLVRPEVTDSGTLRYRYWDPVKKRDRILLASDVFVVRGRFGRGVIEYARQSFELALQLQRFGTETYRRGPRFAGALQHPKTLTDKAREHLRKALDKYGAGGENEGRPLLLEEGMTWNSISLSMKDAEFVATLNDADVKVCQWYRVPQHKIQILTRSTNNNIERQSIDYTTDSIMPWTIRWDQAIRRDLIINRGRFFAEHLLDALLKADTKARYEAYAIAVSLGWMTRNEVRAKENDSPLPGLDEPMTPMNMDVAGTSVAFAPSSAPAMAYLRLMVRDAAARAVRKEAASLGKLAERTGGAGDEWRAGVQDFYREHSEFVARLLRVPDETAERYCEGRVAALVEHGPAAFGGFETDTIADLTETALMRSTVLQLNAGDSRPAEEAA